MKPTLKQRQQEASDSRTANYNHRHAERLRKLRERPQDEDAILEEMQRDFLATYEPDVSRFSSDDNTARLIILMAAIAVLVLAIGWLIGSK